jgi:hypothetical protein
MYVLFLLILLVVLIVKKPSIVETMYAPYKENHLITSKLDYNNYLCSTRLKCNSKNKDCKQKCISIPLVNQRPQNTHPNSVKPIKFVTW